MTHTRSLFLPSAFCLLLLSGLGDTKAYLTPGDVFPDLPVETPADMSSSSPDSTLIPESSAPDTMMNPETDAQAPLPWDLPSDTPNENGMPERNADESIWNDAATNSDMPWWESAATPYDPALHSAQSTDATDTAGYGNDHTGSSAPDAPLQAGDGRVFYRAGNTYAAPPPIEDTPAGDEMLLAPQEESAKDPLYETDTAAISDTLLPAAPESMETTLDTAVSQGRVGSLLPFGTIMIWIAGAVVVAAGGTVTLLRKKKMNTPLSPVEESAAPKSSIAVETPGKRLDVALHATESGDQILN